MEPNMEISVAALDQHSSDTILFLAMKWQEENKRAGLAYEEVLRRNEQQARRIGLLQEDVRYFQNQLENEQRRIRTTELDNNWLSRLPRMDLLACLWGVFGPRNEKIAAIKQFRYATNLGLKDSKDIIDGDWAARQLTLENIDQAPDQEEPVI